MKSVTEIQTEFIFSLDGFGVVCKKLLILFNILFAVVGVTSLVFGLWLNFHGNSREMFDTTATSDNKEALHLEVYDIAVYILVSLGLVIVSVGIFGEHAACNDKKVALQMFSVFLFLLAMAEITVGVLAYVGRDKVGKKLGALCHDVYKLYVKNEDEDFAAVLTFLHSSLHCCGLTGGQPVELVRKTCPKVEEIMEKPCPEAIGTMFNNGVLSVLGFFIGTAALLIGQGICSSFLSSKIPRDTNIQ